MFGRMNGLVVGALVVGLTASAGAQAKDGMGSASKSTMGAMPMDGAEYTIVFKSMWTAAAHPFEYPEAGIVTGPHYSGIIGAAHNASYGIFKVGSLPTPGLERLSEEGKPTPLDEQIKAAVKAGSAASLFTTGPLRDLEDSLVATVRVDPAHPMVSFVAMIAPSPDWFAGAADVNLRENGQWAASRTIQVYAYDSGGDDGMTYKAADKDNTPKKATMQATSRHFAPNGTPVPVGTVTITRK
jgi:hypothetical protein